jgi:hypothetical protein
VQEIGPPAPGLRRRRSDAWTQRTLSRGLDHIRKSTCIEFCEADIREDYPGPGLGTSNLTLTRTWLILQVPSHRKRSRQEKINQRARARARIAALRLGTLGPEARLKDSWVGGFSSAVGGRPASWVADPSFDARSRATFRRGTGGASSASSVSEVPLAPNDHQLARLVGHDQKREARCRAAASVVGSSMCGCSVTEAVPLRRRRRPAPGPSCHHAVFWIRSSHPSGSVIVMKNACPPNSASRFPLLRDGAGGPLIATCFAHEPP